MTSSWIKETRDESFRGVAREHCVDVIWRALVSLRKGARLVSSRAVFFVQKYDSICLAA
jgi:hypothetical protein